jgi:hypothetical protein
MTGNDSGEKLQYRDFDAEARLLVAEKNAIAKVIAPGQVLSLSTSALGIVNVEQAIANIAELIIRAERAFELGFYIEAMSLRLQHMEFWLRIFYIARNGTGRLFPADDKRTFGQIITDCERIGFDAELVSLMRAFNLHRTRAIHKFILGATDYEHLHVICARYVALPARVGEFTRSALEPK